jgi:2-phospho-L-lactate guanylyltransferase
MQILAGVPVKSFSIAKNRLASAIAPEARIAISQEMARRTCLLLAEAGMRPLVLAADVEVAKWAEGLAVEVLVDRNLSLDQAAGSAVSAAAGQPWLLIHADLPLLDSDVLSGLIPILDAGNSVIAPSRDGGTPVIGASLRTFAFGYGPSSYQRHLRLLAPAFPRVVIDPRLAIDLDDPSDLEAVRPRVPWLATVLDSLVQS